MAARNLHFYNQNTTRAYPLADSATAANAQDQRLPTDIIDDLNLQYPAILGVYPFIASVAVTPTGLVSVTIQCANDLDDVSTFAPLAVIAVQNPVAGRQYPVQAQYPGVGGWIVFGKASTPYTGRFTPRAGLLAPRAARPYQPLPVTDMAQLYSATPLTGVVQLLGEPPLEIVAAEMTIGGATQTVAVVQLLQTAAVAGSTAPNVLAEFIGPCGARPESADCGAPEPIQYLNTLQPDCNGNITIQFQGCASIASILTGGGILLNCGLGLSDVCVAPVTSTQYINTCSSSEFSQSSQSLPSSEASESQPTVSGASEGAPGGVSVVPYWIRFDNSEAPEYWETVSGTFTYVSTPIAPLLVSDGHTDGTCMAASYTMNTLAVYNAPDTTNVGRYFRVAAMLLSGGVASNAAFVFNYQAHPARSGSFTWFEALIDRTNQQFSIKWFDGHTLQSTGATADLTNIQLNTWYLVEVWVETGTPGTVNITAHLSSMYFDGFITHVNELASIGPLNTSLYLSTVGLLGFYTVDSAAYLGYIWAQAG
jgi:hypothetical protein